MHQNFTNQFPIIEIKLKLQEGSTNQNALNHPQSRWTRRDDDIGAKSLFYGVHSTSLLCKKKFELKRARLASPLVA